MLNELAQILFHKLKELKEINGGSLETKDLDHIIQHFSETLKSYVNTDEAISMFDQLDEIVNKIHDAKRKVISIQKSHISENFIFETTNELNLVTKTTEKYTQNILDSTEKIITICAKIENTDIKNQIIDNSIKIIEACNFQDLTGQKIIKIIALLNEIEEVTNNLIAMFKSDNSKLTKKTRSPEQKLLNGPQLNNSAPKQKDIDDLFDSL